MLSSSMQFPACQRGTIQFSWNAIGVSAAAADVSATATAAENVPIVTNFQSA